MLKKEIPFKYNKKYYKTIDKDYESTAGKVSKVRWSFVGNINPKVVLDYGAGACFMSKYAPKGITIDTFDIGDFPVRYTGIRHKFYDLIFLFDVLEHIPDFRVLDDIFKKAKHVCISLPILPKGRKLKGWKHFKYNTGEHLHYFTKESLDLFFEARGFERIKSGFPECPPRRDIWSAIYKKV